MPLRGISHLARNPGEHLRPLPLVAFTTIFVALFVEAFAFVTMNRQGWLTRDDDTIGGEGQSASSLGVRHYG